MSTRADAVTLIFKTLRTGAIITASISFFIMCKVATSQPISPPPSGKSVLVISVSDNSEISRLNSSDLIGLIEHPDTDPELYEKLGRPIAAKRTYNFTEPFEILTEEYIDLIKLSRHYVSLRYHDGTDLTAIPESFRNEPRIAYVGVNRFGKFSSVPNDPRYPYTGGAFGFNYSLNDYQWAAHNNHMMLTSAWSINAGWTSIGLLDGGPPTKPDPINLYAVDHEDLDHTIAYNHSWNFFTDSQDLSPMPGLEYISAHGTHVLGLAVANTNNGKGIAGTCWNCTVNYGLITPSEPFVEQAMNILTNSGSQVINLSGGFDPFTLGYTVPPCAGSPTDHWLCIPLEYMELRDVIFVAAAGNNLQGTVQFPASEPTAIAVGGNDSFRNYWDERSWPLDPWDFQTGLYVKCPFDYTPPFAECGSNYSNSVDGGPLDFVAPARKVLSTVPVGIYYYDAYVGFPLNDSNFPDPVPPATVPTPDGYAYGTGTSMAAPIFSGIVALLRSANPLISKNDVYDVLKKYASNNNVYNGSSVGAGNKKGWGAPNAYNSIAAVQGRVAGVVVKNRLTPMFVSINEIDKDRLYTTRPQVAASGAIGELLKKPTDVSSSMYETYLTSRVRDEASDVTSYPGFPGFKPSQILTYPSPVASFWLFTSDTTLWPKANVNIVPLYRMSLREPCDLRHHAYVTADEIAAMESYDQCPLLFGTQTFKLDGIEGYILDACPPGYNCTEGDPSSPQRLWRRYHATEKMSALLLDDQLTESIFTGYTGFQPGTSKSALGFVFPNVDADSDGIPDGMERLYGMDRFSPDSDCDGLDDLLEFPISRIQPPSMDPLLGGTCP